jgi:hypothetical protein
MASSEQDNVSVLDPKEQSGFQSGIKVQLKPIGSSGTEVHGGYFSEEYLQALRGTRGAKIWDEMRRSESTIGMLLNAITNPIKSAEWEFDVAKDVVDSEKHVEFCNVVFKDMIDWEVTLHEILTCLPFGFSLFEIIHNVVFNHPKLGTINGLKALAFRSQKTIQSWQLEKQTGKLLSIEQFVSSDVGGNVTIPGEFLAVFSLHKEGDNYEGISLLRPMYGAWFRKNLYLKLAAIGIEKYAVGTPIGTIPKGKEKSTDLDDFKKLLENFTSHESSYLLKPEGWEIEIQKVDFDASKIKEMILLEDTAMINSAVANFLALGMSGSGGAFALGQDLSDFFLSGIQSYANIACGVFNRKLIPHLINLNYGPQAAYPKLKCTGIDDKAGKELADIVGTYLDKGALKADDPLEKFLRKQHKLPEADPATARVLPKAANNSFDKPAPTEPQADKPVELSEPAQKKSLDKPFVEQFDTDKEALKALMVASLQGIYGELKSSLVSAYKAASPENKIKAGTELVKPDLSVYKNKLKNFLGQVAAKNYGAAARETSSSAKKLTEHFETIKLALDSAPEGAGYYDALPPAIKKLVQAQAELIAETQEADLEKIVSFQFTSSNTATDDLDVIQKDIDESVARTLGGSNKGGMSVEAAASNAVAHVANQARTEYFFEPEVLDGIESFTLENSDPVSDICTELAGKTFAPDDPQVDEYTPPLHHLCKSRMRANLKGAKGNPEIDGKVKVSEDAKKSMTLSERVNFYRV